MSHKFIKNNTKYNTNKKNTTTKKTNEKGDWEYTFFQKKYIYNLN